MNFGDRMREIARNVVESFIEEENTLFKVGDRVICKDPIGSLVLGQIYTVAYVSQRYIGVDSDSPEWNIERFELVEENPTPGYVELFL